MENKEAFSDLEKGVKTAFLEVVYIKDVKLSVDPYSALDAPVTEIALITLHDGVDNKVFEGKLDAVAEDLQKAGASAGPLGGGWGAVKQNDKQFLSYCAVAV